MKSISGYISEAVARHETGKYITFEDLSEKTNFKGFKEILDSSSAIESVDASIDDIAKKAIDTDHLVYAAKTIYKPVAKIYLATPEGIVYIVQMNRNGISSIKRMEYDLHYGDTRCTAEAIAGNGITRLVNEIKEVFRNESK